MTQFITLDANVWIGQRMFRSALGATLLYAVRQKGARIVLPSITRDETVARLIDEGVAAVSKINSGLTTLSAIIGKRPDPDLPNSNAFREAIRARFDELSEFIDPLDVTPEDYARSTIRVIEKRTPNQRKEQFRDSLLLEQLLRVYSREECYLVSSDSDFFSARGSENLAPDLAQELAKVAPRMRILGSIENLLSALGQEATRPNKQRIFDAISREVLSTLATEGDKRGFEIGELTNSSLDAFLTERHDRLFVSFEMSWRAFEITRADGSVIPEGICNVTGTAAYDLQSEVAEDVRVERFRLTALSGEVIHQGVTVFLEGISIGTRSVPFKLRRSLGDSPPT